MARKVKAKPAPTPRPAPVVESGADDPPFLADVEDRIPAGSLDVEAAATVNRIWIEAYEALRDRWETDSANLYDTKERLARADAMIDATASLLDAVEELMDWTERAPLDTIYPIVLITLRANLARALDAMPAVDR